MKKNFAEKFPLVFGIIAFFVLLAALNLFKTTDYLLSGLLRLVASAVMILVMWPAIKNKNLKFNGGGWKDTFKLTRVVIIVTAILIIPSSVMAIIGAYTTGSSEIITYSPSQWPIRLIGILTLGLGIGAAEELCFRQALYFCGVEQFKNIKNIRMIVAIVSSFIFGFVHVRNSLSSDPVAIISAILKTIETGMFGFFLCAALEKGKNIWPLAIMHSIYDLISLISEIFITSSTATSYVVTSTSGMYTYSTPIVYSIMILIYIPTVKKAVKILKEADKANS